MTLHHLAIIQNADVARHIFADVALGSNNFLHFDVALDMPLSIMFISFSNLLLVLFSFHQILFPQEIPKNFQKLRRVFHKIAFFKDLQNAFFLHFSFIILKFRALLYLTDSDGVIKGY